MFRIHCIISGDVVGVGYRAWAKGQTKALGLTGWVKNREDKTVELVAEGTKEMLEKFIAACNKGPGVAWVEGVYPRWECATGEFVGFEVLY